MALQSSRSPMSPFIWGAGGAALTPEQIAQRRQIEDALLAQGVDTSPVGHWTQGMARVANALAGSVRRGRLDKAETANNETNAGLMRGLQGLMGGGVRSAPAQATGATGATTQGGGALPTSFLSAVDRTEGAGAYDTLFGHAQRDGGQFAGTRISEMPISDVLAFADPNGRYSQHVKGKVGHVATPMGRYQIVGSTLRNAVSEMGIDPSTPFNAQTQDQIAGHLARRRIAGASTMDGKISALRSEWAGFKNVPDAQMRQIVADLETAPAQGPQQTLEGLAVGESMPMSAASPMQVADASGGMPPAIMEAMTNPAASPQVKAVAEMLYRQQMQQNDPKRQLEIQKLQREVGERSTTTMDGRLIDSQTGQVIQDYGQRPTSGMQEYDRYAQHERSAGREPLGPLEYEQALRSSGATSISVGGAEKGFDKTIGEGYGKVFLDIRNEAQAAQRALGALDIMEQQLSDPGFYSGAGGETVQSLKRIGASLGMDPDGITSIETFNAMSKQAALDVMGGSLGTGFSNADRDFVVEQVPNLGNTPQGNKRLIDVQRRLNRRKLDIATQAREYAAGNEGRIDVGFDDHLSRWAERNPLFPRRIAKEEDYMNLPTGAEYIAPDGSIRRKP
ncbi:MAG: hypothetical protein M9945_12650 [Aquamicrobium sp.]|uniref:hypothetical protein n=1 Tax=Aquamicrobium sp. TaxID=1872579 RepID=UPI00349E6899|nr:hypothetical protein [Aquamicrobium sp.]